MPDNDPFLNSEFLVIRTTEQMAVAQKSVLQEICREN